MEPPPTGSGVGLLTHIEATHGRGIVSRHRALLADLAAAFRLARHLRQAGSERRLAIACQRENPAPARVLAMPRRLVLQVVHERARIVGGGQPYLHDRKGQPDVVTDRIDRDAAGLEIVRQERRQTDIAVAIGPLVLVHQA